MKDVREASDIFRAFREAPVRRARTIHVKLPKAVAIIGKVRAIEYDTTHGGRAVPYKHKFTPGSAPLMVAGPDGTIYLVEGRYHFTERGIVDLDHAGREIEDNARRRR